MKCHILKYKASYNQTSPILMSHTSYLSKRNTYLYTFFLNWLDDPHLTNEHRTQDCIAS